MCRLGTGKVSFFSVMITFSGGRNDFAQEKLFILTIFTLYPEGDLRQKSKHPAGVTSMLPVSVRTISKCVPCLS